MFNSLRGTITGKLSDALLLENQGLEWELSMPATDLALLPPAGSEVRVWTWLLHREDQMRLYAFLDENRRHTFLELQKVDGIGPRQALKLMGGISQQELERALEQDDLGRLEAVPDMGKKTAQKLLLTLKGRLVRAEERVVASGPHEELANALADMGYDRKTALEALAACEKELSGELEGLDTVSREKLLFRHAIVRLSGA